VDTSAVVAPVAGDSLRRPPRPPPVRAP